MKYLAAFFMLCSAGAWAQTSGALLNSEAHPTEFYSNPLQATQQPLASERSVLYSNGYTFGKGERPVSDFVSSTESQPLGDIARTLKEERANIKKSEVVYVNY